MNTKPPIKCTPCRVAYNGQRYRVYEDGSVGPALSVEQVEEMGFATLGDVVIWEKAQPRYDPHSTEAKTIRQHAAKLRRNRNARERYQAYKDLGLNRTPSGQCEVVEPGSPVLYDPPKIRKSGDMEIQIITPEEGVNYLTIDGVICSIEWDIRNSEEFKRELEVNPDLALAWRDSSIVVEQTFAKRTGKFDDPRRSRSFCEFGEHTINIEQHGGTVCYSHRDLNICARCYVQHVEEYFGVDAPGAAHTRRLYGWVSDSDAAHERRTLKRQLRRAGIEWDRDPPNTANALRDQIRALGLEPMEVCFHRSIECPACVLPAGHEGPHEPTTVKAAEPKPKPEPKPGPQKPVRKSATNTPNLDLFD